jgi:hypothetical protein
MPYNILILPLCAGYFILVYSLLFKYNIQRFHQRRLLFESIIAAIIILVSAFTFRTLIELAFPKIIPYFLEKLSFVPIDKPDYFWTAFFSCVIAVILVILSNYIIKKFYGNYEPIIWAIRKNGDELEKLFERSATEGKIMQLTLKNNKIYIGFCETIPEPQKTNYLVISPVLSGYRDSETKKMEITTDYFKIIDNYVENLDDSTTSVELNTDITIKQDEILTASIYEQEIYDMFNNI